MQLLSPASLRVACLEPPPDRLSDELRQVGQHDLRVVTDETEMLRGDVLPHEAVTVATEDRTQDKESSARV